MLFSVAVVLFDIEKHIDSTPVKFLRSGSFNDHGNRSLVNCLLTFPNDLSYITIEPVSIKLHM